MMQLWEQLGRQIQRGELEKVTSQNPREIRQNLPGNLGSQSYLYLPARAGS